MSLQARLRHSLGERWIELPVRGVDHPLVVGRAAGCDVQIPSVTVAPKHCVLFAHEGRWVVQDVPGAAPGTFVNGAKIQGATFLHVGDVISLAPDGGGGAIDIEPGGVAEGRAGQPAVAAEPTEAVGAGGALFEAGPVATAPGAPPAVPVYPPQYAAYPPGYVAPPAAAVPAPWSQPVADTQPAYAPEGTIADWPADARPHYRPARRRRGEGGGGGVIIGVLLTLLITAGTGYWIYRQRQNAGTAAGTNPAGPAGPSGVARPPVGRSADDTSTAPNIFDATNPRRQAAAPTTGAASKGPSPGVASAPPPDAQASPVPAAQAPTDPGDMAGGDVATGTAPATAASEDPADAAAVSDDPAWKQIEIARHSKDEARAILLFDEYARANPGARAEKVAAYTEKAFDRLWFERIENLCEQRDELAKKIEQTDKDLAEETDDAHRKRVLLPLRMQYESRLQGLDEELKQNMKYQGNDAPNLLDDAEMERLRQARDPQQYAAWKARILTHIRRTHGGLPWVADKTS